MGATRDFVAATFADAFLPALRRPVEDIIYETLDRRQIPTRTDFKEMRDLLNTLRGQVSGATNGVKKLVDRLTGAEDRIDELMDRLDAFEARLAKLEATSGAAQAPTGVTAEQLEARLAALPAPAPAGLTAEQLEARLAAFSEALPAPAPAGITAEALEARLNTLTESLKAAAPAPAPAAPAAASPAPAPARRETCKVPGCEDPGRARGFCARHYQKWRRGTLPGFVSLDGEVTVGGETIKLEGHSGEAYTTEGGKILVNGKVVA